MKWISVKDRLPKEHIEVIVCTERIVTTGIFRTWDDIPEWVSGMGESDIEIKPTHWMPLPKPPKS